MSDDPFVTPVPEGQKVYPRGLYDPFPVVSFPDTELLCGYPALAKEIARSYEQGARVVAMDGYSGVPWTVFQNQLTNAVGSAAKEARKVEWVMTDTLLLAPSEIEERVAPFLGGDDPLFGTHFPLGLDIFFDPLQVASVRGRAANARDRADGPLLVICGVGAALTELFDELWYLDLPKDVIQARARAGEMQNVGTGEASHFGAFYKRSYFVDWPALNRQKRDLLPQIDLLIDIQHNDNPVACRGDEFRSVLHTLAETPFRVRPWFYPGPWGGKYMQGHMGLDPELPNIAWSFELIVPENGIAIESGPSREDSAKLEFSFDFLMYQENKRAMGADAASRFGYEWPIRLDYLDTIDGGNLSTQVHPRPEFIRDNFGETYTQDETYYIANNKPGSRVYVGLSDECDVDEFRNVLEDSANEGSEVDIDRYVHSVEVETGDLVLIPNGTVHCSGAGNLVLEISATPYIFTFKMYDYLRKDLEGNFRPMNLARAFENIRVDRGATFVRANYLAKPVEIEHGSDWTIYELYDRPETFYVVRRIDFITNAVLDTCDNGHAINLVDGERIELVAANGTTTHLSRYETMFVPASAGEIRIANAGTSLCRLITVFIRPGVGTTRQLNDPR